MQLLKNESIVNIMEKTLNYVDARLIGHGKRVAYLMFKVLEPQDKFTNKQLRDICLLAMLHDVGAYKTEEIKKIMEFEIVSVWDHAIYSYLFLKYFSPLKELAPVALFHHAKHSEIKNIDPTQQLLTQLLSLCDRADIFSQHKGNAKTFRNNIEKNRDVKYSSEVVDMFLNSGIDLDSVYNDINSDAKFNCVFSNTPLTEEEASQYVNMIVYSIDFRSSQTVIHTFAMSYISCLLASLLGVSEKEIKKIRTGAMLHDLGKVGVPVHILESTGKLSDEEMEIMKTHVVISEEILEGNVEEEIKNLAINHHEKLTGTGYARKLGANSIAFYDRIVAVADIFSALCGARSYKDAWPKEKIVGILNDMSAKNFIDPKIVLVAVEHFDEILEAVNKDSQPIIQSYEAINKEYAELLALHAVQ